jgi:WD40 repeat protein
MASAGDSGEVIIWKPTPSAVTTAAATAAAADGSGSPRDATPPPLTPGGAAAAATPGAITASTPAKEAAAEAADSSREENVVCGVKWKMAHTLRGHHDDVTDIAWAHDDAVLLTGSVENEVMLFDVRNRQNLVSVLAGRTCSSDSSSTVFVRGIQPCLAYEILAET